MSDSLNATTRLLPLLEMAFQAEQMKMAKIVQRINMLNEKLKEIDRPMRSEPLSAATRAGADLRWDTWAQERKKVVNQELALELRDREQARDHMIAALSKLEAAKKMQANAVSQARQTAIRRASW
ncbi:hypothetical protein SAMN05444287_2545 [Octadecabacter temperatus]|uniref:Uncharacterized protein n=1 Tax=Octadecabacter temperatus TaxID=1458307 RepID=A0A0K0YA38_9RHOB|nr:hypothetical protein [Octadecabacter temperatus]AKS47798.1 hypothetical protein OSB_32850 [Octadecabacter temperatus]SIO38328.1 hypothetical protein SAMN05444287_2545 [Octadecabacter temperatus]